MRSTRRLLRCVHLQSNHKNVLLNAKVKYSGNKIVQFHQDAKLPALKQKHHYPATLFKRMLTQHMCILPTALHGWHDTSARTRTINILTAATLPRHEIYVYERKRKLSVLLSLSIYWTTACTDMCLYRCVYIQMCVYIQIDKTILL